nr:hypothetical protein [Tanacetum cinerariifolium]
MNYVPVDVGTNSTNFSRTKDAANQEVKKDVSSLRYISLPNWVHDDLLESSSSKPKDERITKVPEGSGNPNPTAFTSNPSVDQIETLTVESPIPTVHVQERAGEEGLLAGKFVKGAVWLVGVSWVGKTGPPGLLRFALRAVPKDILMTKDIGTVAALGT